MKNKPPRYTKEDMKILAEMAPQYSVPHMYLPDLNYSPKAFKKYLEDRHQTKDVNYLFELPLNELPKLINRGELSGLLQFRLQIGK
jgi:hypothetical protein